MKNPTFKNQSLELLANVMFSGNMRYRLQTGMTSIPIPQKDLDFWKKLLSEKEKELNDLKMAIAFSEIATVLAPGEVEINYHEE